MMRAPLFRVLYGVTLLAVAIWFSVGTTTAHAQTIPVRLGGNASSIVGVDFELPIEIDMSARTEALGSFAIVVRWDTTVLRFAGGSNGSFGEITVNDDSLAGGALIASGVNPAGASGHVTAGILRLRPVVSDTTTVAVEVRELFAAVTFVDLTPSAVPSSRAYCPAAGRYGDVDGDGLANSRDALIALSASIGLDVSAFNAALGDVDGDGLTRARDALIILSNSVGLDVSGFRVFFIAPGACATSPIVPGFTIEPGDLTVLTGQQVEFTASSVDSSGNTTVLSDVFWQTSDETVVAISPAGQAVAVDTGTAVISAVRGGTTDSAGVTVTVVATRPNHWVDALAFNETNQLGTSQYPFATIQDGVDIARVGDTVRVRAGRYSSGVMVNKGVVVYGELAAAPSGGFAAAPGDLLPRITRGDYDWGFEVQAPGATAEIHNFRIDPMGWPIQIGEAGTVLVDNVHFQQGDQTWSASINSWGSADQILVRNSQFIGGGDYLWTDGIEVYGPVGLLDVRSSTFSDHGSDAIRTYDVASIVMRDNVVQYSGGWGLDACRVCTGAVGATAVEIGGNRFRDNYYGAVNVDPYSTAAFDHNVITGSGYSAIELYAADAGGGETAPAVAATQAQAPEVVTLLGDSIFTDMGSWLHVDGYDSVAVDSVTVNTSGRGGGDSFYEGRILTVSNSRFVLGDYGTAFYVDPWPLTRSDMIVRGVSIDGDPGCLGCSDGIYGYDTWVDADDLTATNLDDAIYVNDGGVIVRNSAFTGNYYDVDAWCSDITVENSTSTDVMGTSIDGYDSSGCGSTLLVTDNQFVRPDYAAIDFYGSGGAAASGPGLQAAAGGHSVVTIQRNITTCDADGYFGFEIDHAEALVSDNVITDCDRPIDVYGALGVLPTPVTVEIRANTITLPSTVGYTGILADGTASLIRIVGNSISGPASYGSIYAGGLSGGAPLANVDSNTIDGGIEASIWSRFVDTLRIRDNVITNHGLATCCVWARSAAIYLGDVSSTAAIAEVLRNRITETRSSGIVLERGFGDTVTIQVDSNTVNVADSVGIWVANYARALLTYNAIDSAALDAVQVDRVTFPADSTAVAINQNNLTNSGRYGVNNLDGVNIDATSNWWNDANGPSGFYGDSTATSVGDSVSTDVIWSPWLTAPAATFTPAARYAGAAAYARRGGEVLEVPRPAAPERPVRASIMETDRETAVRAGAPRLPRVRVLPPDAPAEAARVMEADRVLRERIELHRERDRERAEARAARERTRQERKPEKGTQ